MKPKHPKKLRITEKDFLLANRRAAREEMAGQDQNAVVTKIFSKDAHGCVVMSDATNEQTREA